MTTIDTQQFIIGQRLKQFRKETIPLNQKLFCNKLGIIQSTYSQYESGARRLPQDLLIKLHANFSLNINWLLTGKGPLKVDVSGEPTLESTLDAKPRVVKMIEGLVKLSEGSQDMIQGTIDLYLKKEGKE